MNPHPQRVIIKGTRTPIKHHAMMRASLYANLTRVVNKRRASLLGLDVGSQPMLVSCQQHLVQLSSL